MKAKAFIDRGDLVPDDVTIPMVLETLKDKGQGRLAAGRFSQEHGPGPEALGSPAKAGMKLDYVVEILLPRETAKNRIMGRRLCVNDPNHPNNIFIDAIKPDGDKCRVCGGDLKTRADDQDEGPSTSGTTSTTTPPPAPWPRPISTRIWPPRDRPSTLNSMVKAASIPSRTPCFPSCLSNPNQPLDMSTTVQRLVFFGLCL
jgi:hypothetical protein